jgi:hypothetical protein
MSHFPPRSPALTADALTVAPATPMTPLVRCSSRIQALGIVSGQRRNFSKEPLGFGLDVVGNARLIDDRERIRSVEVRSVTASGGEGEVVSQLRVLRCAVSVSTESHSADLIQHVDSHTESHPLLSPHVPIGVTLEERTE